MGASRQSPSGGMAVSVCAVVDPFGDVLVGEDWLPVGSPDRGADSCDVETILGVLVDIP